MTADEEQDQVTVDLPAEAPMLTPRAARVLLRIVRDVANGLDERPSSELDERLEAA